MRYNVSDMAAEDETFAAKDTATRRFRRISMRKYKGHEARKSCPYQAHADKYARNSKKKGRGLALKYKGETMPTQVCSNDKTAKSWVKAYGGRESYKTAFIFSTT